MNTLPRLAFSTSCLALLAACAAPLSRTVTDVPALEQDRPQSKQEREARERRRERERREREERLRRHGARGDRGDERGERGERRRFDDNPDWPKRQSKQDPPRRGRDRSRSGRRGDRRSRVGTAYVTLSYSDGDFDYQNRGTGRDYNTADLFRVRTGVEGRRGIGGGLDIKYFRPEDDAYLLTANPTEVRQSDVFLFITGRPGDGRFRIPARVGPYLGTIATERLPTGQETNYHNLGIRAEISPQLSLYRRGDRELALFTNLTAGAHLTAIDDDITDEEYGSSGTTFGLEPGIRWRTGSLELSASYFLWETTVSRSDTERGIAMPRVETEFDGFQFSLGIRF